MRRRAGYVLLEAVGAMAVLSMGIVGVHQAMRETIVTRGQARDFTQARFLMDELLGELQLQPLLAEGTQSGDFGEGLARFHWSYTVTRVELRSEEEPQLALDPNRRPIVVKRPVNFMCRIEVTVSWTHRGQSYSQTTQTLCQPEKLPVPDEQPL